MTSRQLSNAFSAIVHKNAHVTTKFNGPLLLNWNSTPFFMTAIVMKFSIIAYDD